MTAFYATYRRLCEKAGKSDNAVAAEIGLSNSTVTSWRQGALPRRPTIKKVADYFGVSFEQMMGYTEKETAPTPEDERDVTFDDFTYAMYEEGKELTPENKEKLLEMARFFKQQQQKNKNP